jgi:hypothetical protein
MRLSKIAALAIIVGMTGSMSVSPARATANCPILADTADWGENSTADISVASGESCLFPIRMRGTASTSAIEKKPAHGKLKKVDMISYRYTPDRKYKGSDSFVIKATGKGPSASGTSVITVSVTIK